MTGNIQMNKRNYFRNTFDDWRRSSTQHYDGPTRTSTWPLSPISSGPDLAFSRRIAAFSFRLREGDIFELLSNVDEEELVEFMLKDFQTNFLDVCNETATSSECSM